MSALDDTILLSEHVSVTRKNEAILQDVSLTVLAGDFTTIIGPNGAGKSMLLKCMMGFYTPDQGRIWKKNGLKIGYVPQNLTPDPTLPITVSRFLTLRLQPTPAMIERVVTDLAIANSLEMPLHILSGGQLQRVLLARALLGEPDLLVLDEPAQNLDMAGQLAFYRELERIYAAGQGLAILMVSHDLHMVMASSQRVVCLYHRICCSGEPQVVMQTPEFATLFGTEMANMMAVYQHGHSPVKTPSGGKRY